MNKDEIEQYLIPETFLEKAFTRLKQQYPCLSKEDLDPNLHFDIEKVDDQYKFVLYIQKDDNSINLVQERTLSLTENSGKYSFWTTHSIYNCEFDLELLICDIYRQQEKYLFNNYDPARFPYGHDFEVYFKEAFEALKKKISWITTEDLNPHYQFAIEKIDQRYEYIEYFVCVDGSKIRTIIERYDGMNPKEFTKHFINRNENYVTLKKNGFEECSINTGGVMDSGGWRLERYIIKKDPNGDFTLFVQSGDRYCGGFMNHAIPKSCLEATNFDDFFARYIENVSTYGIPKENLYNNLEFRTIFGYK